jgi:C-terminal processing protease CtpA/Prc
MPTGGQHEDVRDGNRGEHIPAGRRRGPQIGTERWLTPKGRAIWHEGLVPDEVVELPEGAAQVVPDDFAALGASGLSATRDAQLKAALAALDRAPAGERRVRDRAA